MDKVKDYLVLARKHHFWIICGVVLLASMTCWWLAESRLDKEFKEQTALIDGKFTTVKSIVNTADHPNDKVTEKLREKVLGIAENVFKAWEMRFNEQLEVPQWQGNLSEPFLQWIKTHEGDVEMPRRFREEYQNFIRDEIETLFAQVDVRDLEEIESAVTTPAPAGRPSAINRLNQGQGAAQIGVTHEWKGIVAWDETLREALRAQYDWRRVPTSQQVRYANEDLWIYRALLDIIDKTNRQPPKFEERVKEHLVASIKQIDGVYIGPLVQPPTMFFVPIAAVPGATAGGEGGEGSAVGGGEGGIPGGEGGGLDAALAPPPAPGGGAEGGGGEGGAEAAVTLTVDESINANLKHLRYVDAKGKPLGWSQAEPFAEFKIMPFEMRLLMDQRKIPEFLANCANSPLPVEVRQVGIISTEPPLANANGGGGGEGRPGRPGVPGMQGGGMARAMPRGMGGMPGGEGGIGMNRAARPAPRMPGGEGGAGGASDLGSAVELRPADLHVEIRGVIYIFNKPDRNKVGKTPPAPEPTVVPAPDAAAAG